jgi:hypothetical protein
MRCSTLLAPLILVTACSESSFKTFNSSPTATINSHGDGAERDVEASTELYGRVADRDHSDSELTVNWSVDSEIICADSAPLEDGYTNCTVTLEAGSHDILLEVRDPTNASGNDNISLTVIEPPVNAPPEVTLIAPVDGIPYPGEEPIEFRGSVSDAEDDLAALRVWWESDVEGLLDIDVTVDGDGGFSSFITLPIGTHVVTLTGEDTAGAQDTESVVVEVVEVGEVNHAPSIASVEITPDPASANDTLDCAYTGFSDPDGDANASTLEWTVNGDVVGTTATLADRFTAEDTVRCTVTPSDGALTGTPLSDEIVITNSIPIIDAVVISPNPAASGDALRCDYSGFFDGDGDEDNSTLLWQLNGVDVGTDPDLGIPVDKGDEVGCTVTPHDGTVAGTPVSDALTVGNAPPIVLTVDLSPAGLYTDDTLTAMVTTDDTDGDVVTPSYAWSVNGLTVAATGSSLDGTVYFDKHDEVTVTVTPSDGDDDGDPMTADPVTVRNTPPSAPLVSIEAVEAEAEWAEFGSRAFGTEMTTPYFYGDIIEADEDVTLETFAVYGSASTCTSVDYYVLSAGSIDTVRWYVEWSSTGHTWSSSAEYNSAGEVGLEITAGQFYAVAYGVNCSGGLVFYSGNDGCTGCTSDAGFGETVGYFGQDYPGPSGFDGTVTSYDHITGPFDMAVEFSTGEIEALVCIIDTPSTDADSDAITTTFAWDVDGTPYTDTDTTIEPDDTVPGDALGYDESWTCTVTPNDGEEDGLAGVANLGTDSATVPDPDPDPDPGCTERVHDGSDYLFCNTPMEREDAVAACNDVGMDLVTIHSSTENDWIHDTALDLISDMGTATLTIPVWIGLTAEGGSLYWDSGEPVTYDDIVDRDDGDDAWFRMIIDCQTDTGCHDRGEGGWFDLGLGLGHSFGFVCNEADDTPVMPAISVDHDAVFADLAATPDGERLYATRVFHDDLIAVSTSDLSLIATIPVGGGAQAVRLSVDGRLAYVAVNSSPGHLVVVDTDPSSASYHTVLEDFTLSGNGSLGVGVSPMGDQVFALTQRPAPGTVDVYDADDLFYLRTLYPSSGGGSAILQDMVFTPDGDAAYISIFQSDASSNVAVYDRVSDSFVDYIDLLLPHSGGGPGPMAMVDTSTGLNLWIGNNSWANDGYTVVDAETDTVIEHVDLPGATGSMPGVCASIDSAMVFVMPRDADIMGMDADTRTQTHVLTGFTDTYGCTASTDGASLFLSSRDGMIHKVAIDSFEPVE